MTKYQRKKLNELLHKYVRLRDGEWCLKCNRKERLQLSHIYPKGRYRSMEFDSDNVKLLCASCHLYWWHKNPIEAHEWLQTVIPEKRLKRLWLMKNTVGKVPDYYITKLFIEKEIEVLEKQ